MPDYLKHSPFPLGPYSTAVKYGNLLFVSGQIPVDENGEVVGKTVKEQTLKALEQLYRAAGWPDASSNCLAVRVYTTDIEKAAELNEAYLRFHEDNRLPLPARELVGVSALPKGALVEIAGIFALESHWEEK
ncbi:MAG: Rid family hydrolase [Actinobacteria bacterium]|nr:Rid family hydrolase [Actinomycetota bacterium]